MTHSIKNQDRTAVVEMANEKNYSAEIMGILLNLNAIEGDCHNHCQNTGLEAVGKYF